MHKAVLGCVFVFMFVGALWAPASAQHEEPAPGIAPAKRVRTVALLFDSLISPFWLESRETLRREAHRRGWSVLEELSNMDDNRQYQQVQAMIQRGVDGIVIIQTDNKAVIPAIRIANAANIPVVHFNRPPAPSNAYSVAVVTDNRQLMRRSVLALIEKARQRGERCKAAILIGDLGDLNAVHRRQGFDEAVAANRDAVEVVAQVATEWNADKAFAGLSNALRAHPDINMVVVSSDSLTPQVEQALRQAGKWEKTGHPGHVWIAGFDGDEYGYRQLAEGYYDVDGVQDLDKQVELTYFALEQQWRGEKPPRMLFDPGFLATQENLATARDRVWGYRIWLASGGAGDRSPTGSPEGGPATSSISYRAIASELFLAARVMFSPGTALDVFKAMLPLAILVAGELLVMLLGQIDVSMAAIMGMTSILAAVVMTRCSGSDPLLAVYGIAVALAVGAVIGAFNGICTALLRMPSFIVTLATMMTCSGAALWYASSVTDTISISGLPTVFTRIGYGSIWGVPIALVVCIGALLLSGYVLSRTMAGRWIYAIGHNPQTARISGVPVAGVVIGVFTVSGICAGMASVIYTSRMETGSPVLGQNMLLDIIGAAVVGGVSLMGGRGNIRMVIVGVAFLSLLDKALQVLGLSFFLVLAIKGAAILAAAFTDIVRRKRRAMA